MPKDSTKPTAGQSGFHDHNKRPFVARQYTTTASNVAGGSSSSFVSSLVTGTAPPTSLNDASTYPMPMDVDNDGVDDEVPPLLPAGPALYTGLPGVKVIPLPRKRYKNSVRTFSLFHIAADFSPHSRTFLSLPGKSIVMII